MMSHDFYGKFEGYFEGCQKIYRDYHERMGFGEINMNKYEYSVGKRYIKVIYSIGSGRSVHSFVDMKNGDVLKPAGWAKPAKHARGNIFDEHNGLKNMGPHGPAYLR